MKLSDPRCAQALNPDYFAKQREAEEDRKRYEPDNQENMQEPD